LNLLQKHTLEEAKDLLEKSFAEYLAQIKLVPEQQAIAQLTSELSRIDVELAGIDGEQFNSYEKLRDTLKEEQRLLEILYQQAEAQRKKEIAPFLQELYPGRILHLKGKHIKIASPLTALLVTKLPGSGQAKDFLCLGSDNRWYLATNGDVVDIHVNFLSDREMETIVLPSLENLKLGAGRKNDNSTLTIAEKLKGYELALRFAPEIMEQKERIARIEQRFASHPLQQWKNPGELIKKHKQRNNLRDKLHKSQQKYQKSKSNKSYYWEEFLNLIKVLQEFGALDGCVPTPLGQAAATIRGDNELWLALAIMSGELDILEPPALAAAICALITESPRTDVWCNYPTPQEVLDTLGVKKRKAERGETSVLRDIRPHLFQTQYRYGVSFPVWRECELVGLVEHWVLGVEWHELCENTNLDEGDLVRMLRRTVDFLWQIPQIPGVSRIVEHNARVAISQMQRFPV
jgi:superfamily II RNA helicase